MLSAPKEHPNQISNAKVVDIPYTLKIGFTINASENHLRLACHAQAFDNHFVHCQVPVL